MKSKGIIIITVIFFLLVNTTYYWEGKFGLLAYPALLFLVVVYVVLVIVFVRELFLAIREKFRNRHRFLTVGLLIFVLMIVFYKPFGLIDFERLESGVILTAEREGAANCMTTFKLKADYTFREKNVCFGVTEIKGEYHLQGDTIYFENVNIGRDENSFYQFALIKSSNFNKDGKHFDLIRYKSLKDTVGHELWITQNELNKLKDKKLKR